MRKRTSVKMRGWMLFELLNLLMKLSLSGIVVIQGVENITGIGAITLNVLNKGR